MYLTKEKSINYNVILFLLPKTIQDLRFQIILQYFKTFIIFSVNNCHKSLFLIFKHKKEINQAQRGRTIVTIASIKNITVEWLITSQQVIVIL